MVKRTCLVCLCLLCFQAEEKKKEVKKEAPKEISLLDGKRAMNTSIAIARIKMTFAETRQVIMNMDETALPSNVLQSLQVPKLESSSLRICFFCVCCAAHS